MKTIYKYPFQPNDFIEIEMPIDSKVLTIETQHEMPCMWVEQDTDKPKYKQKFAIVGTGQNLVNTYKYGAPEYVGSFQMSGGRLVFHVYKLD